MRLAVPAIALGVILGTGSAVAEPSAEMLTAPNAILCLSKENVGTANKPPVSKSQTVLRAMGCLRSEPGIRVRMLDPADARGPVRVRFYPAGIATGIVLWTLPSSFVSAERARLVPAVAAARNPG